LAPTLTTYSLIVVNADELAYQFRAAEDPRGGQQADGARQFVEKMSCL
jgi:hypothetical protein